MKKQIYALPFLLILGALFLLACNKNDSIEKKVSSLPTSTLSPRPKSSGTSTTPENLKFMPFGFPQQVEGCSCYFAADRTQFIKQNYIYVDDFNKNAFVRLSDDLISLPYGKNNKVAPLEHLMLRSKNKEYELTIEALKIDQGEIETALYRGKMTLITKDGTQIESPIYGECGC